MSGNEMVNGLVVDSRLESRELCCLPILDLMHIVAILILIVSTVD